MTMIEKVAEAINAAGKKWADEHTFDFWDEAPLQVYAKAAIEAMMTPSEDMKDAGADVGPDTPSGAFGWDHAEQVYQAMIKKALEE